MNPDPNLTCLRSILRDDKKALSEFLGKNFDFDGFLKFCERHLLAGYVFSAAGANGTAASFPGFFMDKAKNHFMNQWAINERLISEMEKLLNIFGRENIDLIFLKGPFLGERFYQQAASRVTRDIDILVRREDVNRADIVLQAIGFERRSRLFLGSDLTVRFTHHFEYAKPGTKVELHWVLARHFSFRIDYEKMWARKKTFRFRDKTFRVLEDEEELVMQILSIFTDIPLGTLVLKQFVDVYQIIKNIAYDKERWGKFFQQRKREGLLLIAVNILDLVLKMLRASEDFPELSEVLGRYNSLILMKSPEAQNDLIMNANPFGGRVWSFRLCDDGPWKAFGWWVISMPFRLAAYQGWKARLGFSGKSLNKKDVIKNKDGRD